MKKMAKIFVAAVAACAMLFLSASCAFTNDISAADLMEGYQSARFTPSGDIASTETVDFALTLLGAVSDGGNVVISPYSILSATALLANGAKGETLAELENAIGMKLDRLNEYLPSYTFSLPTDDKAKFTTANSIWLRDDGTLHVEPEFLQKNADLYGADAFVAPFDESTLRDINNWIANATDGEIKNMLDMIPSAAAVYLVNAVLFDAEWETKFESKDVYDREFTNAAGDVETVSFMHDDEGTGFELDGAVGLVRRYLGGKYEFAAILPDEGTTPEEYLAKLDGKTLSEALCGTLRPADTAIPDFTIEFEKELSEVLQSLGIKSVFDAGRADLSALGHSDNGNLYVSRVLHKAKIEVNEHGTKASAATIIEACGGAAEDDSVLNVYLTRPFIFFVNDTATHTPIFCGIVNSVKN